MEDVASEVPVPREQVPGTGGDERWQRQVTSWAALVEKYGLQPDRYADFEYLLYLPLDDRFTENYVRFQLGLDEPIIKHRIRNHLPFWKSLTHLPWLLEVVEVGISIPFEKEPPCIMLPNNKTAVRIWYPGVLHYAAAG